MPFGTLKTKEARGPIPLCSPPYPVGLDEFTDITALVIQYHTTYDAVKDLVPEECELDDEPLVTLTLLGYGMGPIGAYNEFVSQVQVTWQGKKYTFAIELVLNNEGAIYAGRERWGIPKVMGNVVWDPSKINSAPNGIITGHVERPAGCKLVQFGFKPEKKLQDWGPLNNPKRESLQLRSIPAANCHDPPVLREFIPTWFEMTHAEVWKGEGSIGLFNGSEFDPIHRLKVVRYVGAAMLRNARAVLHPVTETFAI
ncbi:acetoacetate decarboxylase [Fusarium beomiforme]|uniref:Acetoacetate decarboxylase n=1 Tax=Fusarium beomiforme TaxID=44412 RepID=A0A9P5AGM0_9HYPO|nr:acetoacetate decarboxylase [Fusarium beomiforme]